MQRRRFLQTTLVLTLAGCGARASRVEPGTNGQPLGDGQAETTRQAKPGANQQPLRFGVIADPQYADQPVRGSRHYRNSLQKLRASIAELNQHDLDFVVTLGDVIDKDFKSFATIMPLYEQLTAPHHLVFGNHDFDVADEDKPNVPQAMNLDPAWDALELKNWRLIFLDGTEVATYRYRQDDPRTAQAKAELQRLQQAQQKNAFSWNSGIGPAQLTWLQAQLDKTRSLEQRAIVFCHFPVMPVNEAHNLWNAAEVVSLLDQYDHVAAYMNGHNHGGNYAEHEGCHYINFKGMVETEYENAFAIVECSDSHIKIDGYGLEPDQELS